MATDKADDMDYDSLSSSLDPISILADSSPAKAQRAGTPIKAKSSTLISPTKSVVLSAPDPDGNSPWRIKVTVEAERGVNINRSLRIRSHVSSTTNIPVRAAETSPAKRRGRPRKSTMTATARTSPARRQTRRMTKNATNSSVSANVYSDGEDEAHDAPPATIHAQSATSQAGCPNRVEANINGFTHEQRLSSTSTAGPHRSFSPSPSTVNGNAEQADQAVTADRASRHDLVPEYAPPGDATTIESEEFSMISVDSLSSHQHQGSPSGRVPSGGAKNGRISAPYMPSSPPTLSYPLQTPQLMQSPEQPDAPLQSFIKFPQLVTPLRESAVRSGKVLQDIVRSPVRQPAVSRGPVDSDHLFAGFSADTRRQLRQSLKVGAAMAQPTTSSPQLARSSSSGIKYPNIEVSRLDHRLPTPDERDQEKSGSTLSSGPPTYPQITPPMHERPACKPLASTSNNTYDMMSWAPTGPGRRLASPAQVVTASSGPQRPAQIARPPNVIEVPSDPSEELSEDYDEAKASSPVNGSEGTERTYPRQNVPDRSDHPVLRVPSPDIWQEEAIETIEEQAEADEISALFEPPVLPRRSKIPGTWRRTSGNHFHYSDSPVPEDTEQRKISGTDSENDSGVVTPPTTDDEADEVGQADEEFHDSFQEDDRDKTRQAVAPPFKRDAAVIEGVLSPYSDGSSPEGDETGLFWQNNLPNIFHGRRRQQNATEMSAISELKPISSPAKSTTSSAARRPDILERSNRARVEASRIHQTTRNEQRSSPLLSSPLRKSLLKSSKIGSSPRSKLAARSGAVPQNHPQNLEHHVSPASQKSAEYTPDTSDDPNEQTYTKASESFLEGASIASDARQLLSEMKAHQQKHNVEPDNDEMQTDIWVTEDDTRSDFETTYLNGSRSYVENLNLSSPTKIKVKFNDSSHVFSSMAPKPILSPRKYHSLFDDDAPLGASISPQQSDGTVVDSTQTELLIVPTPARPSNLLSRMNSSFWSAVTTKSPVVKIPQPAQEFIGESSPAGSVRVETTICASLAEASSVLAEESSLAPTAMPVVRDTMSIPDTNTSDAILRLRRRYGLLAHSHPFTMHHARTMHRLLNSIRSHGSTTLIPSTSVLALPAELESLLGTAFYSNTFKTNLVYTTEHLRVVNAFVHLLASDEERERLERNGQWGDEGAAQAKGWDKRGRHGTWFAFAGEGRGDKEARGLRGEIESTWVAGVLAELVLKEERMRKTKSRV